MWSVQKIYLVLSENPGKLYLLPNRVVCQFGSYDFRLGAPGLNQALFAWRENQQILPLGLLSQDRLNQALHIPANAGILDSPQVERNLHGFSCTLRTLIGSAPYLGLSNFV